MKIAPELDGLLLFIVLIFPGLISMHIYRFLMPTREIDWKSVFFEATFYGALNFGFCLPVIIPIHRNEFPQNHTIFYIILLFFVLIISPVVLPFMLRMVLKCKWIMKGFQLPDPTAWDYFFDKRKTCYMLIHLKTGELIGGIYGKESFATSYPRHGDLYLEKVIRVNEQGEFLGVVEGSMGILISSASYDYIEIF